MSPSERGGVDVAGQVGVGADPSLRAGFGGAAMQVEPFVSEKVSLPVSLGGAAISTAREGYGLAPARVGVRHRATPRVAWGAGAGPSLIFNERDIAVAAIFDLELILGREWDALGFSFGMRPSLSTDFGDWFIYAVLEPEVAFRLSEESRITFGLLGGPYFTASGGVGGFWGAGLGIHRRF